MNIFSFSDFTNENVILTVLDCVIDEQGNLYNDTIKGQYPLRKGNIVKQKERGLGTFVGGIIGSDKKEYLAGIDKNGELVAAPKNISNGYLVDEKGMKVRVPSYVRGTRSKFWKFYDVDATGKEIPNTKYDYAKLIPITPTGWVNTKVDMEVVKKVRRYSKGLGSGRGRDGFVSKLADLERISTFGLEKRKRSRTTIQKEMSVIMLLHYISEIKNFFTPSAAGFLFESFLGGMIRNAKVSEDNSKADIRADGETWQIKLYDGVSTSSLPVAYMNDKVDPKIPVDHFVICLKFADRIEVVVLKGIDNVADPLCYKNFLTDVKEKDDGTKSGGNFSVSEIKSCQFKYTIELLGIEEKIESIAEGLKQSIDDIYNDLSQFQYNIESIITGVDEKGKLLNITKFDDTYNDSIEIARGLDVKITSLYKTIKNEP